MLMETLAGKTLDLKGHRVKRVNFLMDESS